MLQNKTPFFCRAIRPQLMGLSCEKPKSSFLRNYEKKIQLNAATFCQYNNDDSAVGVPLRVACHKGIGIVEYFEGKNIFITGTTGLLGKVLVEKILRSTPVGKIYVLVKGDDPEAAMDRLGKELVNSELFGCLREKYGKLYHAIIREKLIPVVGNICEPSLGMDSDSATEIMEEVNVIIASAAITTLEERYDLLLDTNVRGTQRLMRFAKACKNLELLVHVSTAYVSGEEEGTILEKPLTASPLFPGLDVAAEINMALRSSTATTNYDMTRDMKTLGLQRARLYGWFNAYHMTKAMAEMVIHETRGDVPVLIIRPSVIESCYKEPLPGWTQGNRMFDQIIISYGKGQLPAFFGNPDAPMDVVPVDIAVNTTIAAIAKHGYMQKPAVSIYQVASGAVNPLQFSNFFEHAYEYFDSEPLIESASFTRINYYNDLTNIKYFDNFNDFSKYTRRNQTQQRAIYAEHLCKMYEFLGFPKARFHVGNTEKLLSEMSKEEQISFAIDVTKIDWRKYFQEVQIPGLRKHILNDKLISD